MKLFFLGGTSFLGKEVIRKLQHEAHELTVLVRGAESAKKLEHLKVKVLQEEELGKIPKQDIVLNFVVDYGKNKPFTEVLTTNVTYPMSILEKISFDTVINFSTGLNKEVSSYAFTKRTLEDALNFLGTQNGSQIINLRLQHFFGPRAPLHNFVTFLVTSMLKGEELKLTDCTQKRDFIFSEDLIEAISLIIEKKNSLNAQETIEIGSGESLRLLDFVETIKRHTQTASSVIYGAIPKRANEPQELVADITKIKKLGWTPKTNLDEALKRTLEYYRGLSI